MKKSEHLPVIGIGPIIVIPELLLTVAGITLSFLGYFDFARIVTLKIPFMIIGIALICFSLYMWFCANFKIKIDRYIIGNKLATTGIYGIVRNPIYSAFYFLCIGAILIAGNWILFIIPSLCWFYMTIMLKHTEEKWLLKLYGKEYSDYCIRVNRIIPWFPHR